MQERLDWIDAVKGTCLLLVMIAHLWQPCPTWVAVLTAGYMQVFFVMAGITAVAKSCSFREQIGQKAKRLLVPYFFYGIVFLLLGVILPTQADLGKGALGLLYGRYTLYPPYVEANIPLLQACGYLSPLWFLPCIFISYMLLAWYDRSRFPYLIVLLAIAAGIVTPLLPILLPWSIEMSFVGFLLMLFGRLLRSQLLVPPFKLGKAFVFRLLIWLGCAAVYLTAWKIDAPVNMSLSQMGNITMYFPLRFVFFCLLGISETLFLALFFRALYSSFLTKTIAYVGRQALRLMCIHLFIGQGVFYLLANRGVPLAVTFACALAVIFIANYILDSLFSRKQSASDIPTEQN